MWVFCRELREAKKKSVRQIVTAKLRCTCVKDVATEYYTSPVENFIIRYNSPFCSSLIASNDAIAENNEWKMTCNMVDN